MTTPPPITRRRELPAIRDERLGLYALVGIAAIVAGIFDGGLRLILIGVPFVVALAVGGRHRSPAQVAVSAALDTERCVEGDIIAGRLDVNAPPDCAIELAIAPATDSITPADDQPWAWAVPTDGKRPIGVAVEMLTERWGRFVPGTVEVRLNRPGSLFEHRAELLELPSITVLPSARRLDALLRIDRAPATAGVHPTRSIHSGGYDFAEVRDYRPGDRLRDLNWSATLRRDEPAVNHRLPERAGDVVIVIDTFPDALRRHSEVSRDVIIRAGRLAWTVLTSHLAANDRVGVVIEGARPLWLSPQGGRRAKYALFAALLETSVSSADPIRNPSVRTHGQVPAAAAVLAISPLARSRTIDSLVAMRGHGQRVEAIALDSSADLRTRAPRLPETIVRVRNMMFTERVAALRRHGIPVVVSTGDDGIATVRQLAQLPTRNLSTA